MVNFYCYFAPQIALFGSTKVRGERATSSATSSTKEVSSRLLYLLIKRTLPSEEGQEFPLPSSDFSENMEGGSEKLSTKSFWRKSLLINKCHCLNGNGHPCITRGLVVSKLMIRRRKVWFMEEKLSELVWRAWRKQIERFYDNKCHAFDVKSLMRSFQSIEVAKSYLRIIIKNNNWHGMNDVMAVEWHRGTTTRNWVTFSRNWKI